MQKAKSLIFIFLFLAWPAPAAELFLGASYHYYNYRETVPEPAKSTERGWIFIPRGEVSVPLPGGAGLASEAHHLNAQFEYSGIVYTTYDGTFNDAAYTPVVTTNRHLFWGYEATFNFKVLPGFFLRAGYGSKTWVRILTAGTEFKEIYSWNYLPLGARFLIFKQDKIEVEGDFVYKIMSDGKIQVIFSETVLNGDDTTLTLGNMPGYRVAAPVTYRIQPQLSIVATPYLEQSAIGKSNTGYNRTQTSSGDLGFIYEPESRTTQFGLLVMAGILF